MRLYEYLSLGLVFLMASLAIWRIQVGVATIKADYERRKKQATIDFMIAVRPMWQRSQRLMGKYWGRDPLSEGWAEIDRDPDAKDVMIELLGHLEHMAVGANTGVFDKDLLFRTSAYFLTNIFYRLRPYIKKVQATVPTAYVEFEQLAVEFEERHRLKPPKIGEIVQP